MDRETALASADFGRGTAERDGLLTEVFVETDMWRRVYEGQTDVVLGPKGSGKSAIYGQVLRASGSLRRRKIIVVGAESPADDPIFSAMAQTRGLQVREFVGLWKLYFLATVVAKLRDQHVRDRTLAAVMARLQSENLLPDPGQSTMVELFNRALRYADVQFRLKSEVAAAAPPAVGSVQMAGTITLHEPTADQPRTDTITVSRLLLQLGAALAKKKLVAWILVDRLDTAFASVGEEVESVALRALVQTYIDLVSPQFRLSLKLFLRDDVWPRISAVQSDRMPGANVLEASRLEWGDDRLLDLICRRIAHNRDLCQFLGVGRRGAVRENVQRELVARLLPAGSAWSFAALLNRLRDGGGNVAPRELIRLMSEARSVQASRLEMRNARFIGNELFEAATLESALLRVSEDRLFQVMCAEYPLLHRPVTRLVGQLRDQSLESLARHWGTGPDEAKRMADQLAGLGFFDATELANGIYRIAPLYRPALSSR